MKHLLKADFYRIRKSSLLWIVLALVILFPLALVLLYNLLALMMRMLDALPAVPAGMESLFGNDGGLSGLFNAKSMLTTAFALSDNLGLVLPIFAGIFVCGDASSGTMRNKVIAGHSRTRIYLSHLISSGLFSGLMTAVYAAFTLLFAFLFFDYGEPVTGEVIRHLVLWAVLGILTFMFTATVSTLFASLTGNTALTIVFTLLFCVAIGLVNSLLPLVRAPETVETLLFLLPAFGSQFALDITGLRFVLSVLSFLLFGTVNTLIGLHFFRKKDLK